MKKVEAIIRPSKLDDLRLALQKIHVYGMTIYEVNGMGKQTGPGGLYRGQRYQQPYIDKIKIDIMIADEQLDDVIATIISAARTGEVGDGRIYVSDVLQSIRIRTGEPLA